MTDSDLYLELSNSIRKQIAIVRVERSTLPRGGVESLSEAIKRKRPLGRLPVHILDDAAFPSGANNIDVKEITAWTLGDLRGEIDSCSKPTVFVISVYHDSNLDQLRQRYSILSDKWAPILGFNLSPSERGFSQNYLERPAWQRTWWLLVPFTVVGDIITSPIQFIGGLIMQDW